MSHTEIMMTLIGQSMDSEEFSLEKIVSVKYSLGTEFW